ncbi:MAG TPA: extracellular solute-binding protein [Verrucomicrobiae bacterium]|jgi:iron(III) transport system substrate-binding protein|nr:extracellular solute-binding protein [Verrucomicrobiae bacterium]
MTHRKLLVLSAFAGLLSVQGLTAAQQPAPAADSAKLIEGAKKEGQAVWYTTTTLDQSQQVVQAFEKKYPFIKVTLFRTGGGPLLNKILTENRGGLNAWDVVVGRGEMVLPLIDKKLLATYVSAERKMIYPDLADKRGYWTAWYVNGYVLGYNTKLVKKDDVPKTYEALLNPKWKGGQISVDTEAFGMLQGLIGIWGKEKAVNYFKRLAAMDPVPRRGNTERVQLTLAGEYPLLLAYNQTIERMTQRKAPIDWVPLEPVVIQVNPALLSAKAPHPNAARLFLDFLLSKDGGELLRGFQRIPVRTDVEPDPARLFRGFKYVIESPEGYKNFDETVSLYNSIFKLR